MGRTDEVQFMLQCVAEWRRLGARVTFEPGWETRGNGLQGNYEGCLVHHTASPSSAARPFPTRSVLIGGRSDLPGPLCNVAGPWCADNDPLLHVIAAFPANHAGASGGRSMGPLPVSSLFNPRVLGLEIDYAGSTPMTGGQRRAALIFTRGTTSVLGRSTEYARAHAETSITGKWDAGYASGKTIDMAAFRRDAAAITAAQEDDLDATQAKQLAEVHNMLTGRYGPGNRNMGDMAVETLNRVSAVHGKVIDSRFGIEGRPGEPVDDMLGHILSIRAVVERGDAVDPAAMSGALRPIIAEAVAAGMAADNKQQAEEIVDRIAARLTGA